MKQTVAMARLADLKGTLAQEQKRPLFCQDHLKISILKANVAQIERKPYGDIA